MNTIEFGKFIANLRNKKKLTQEELAERLYIDKRKVSRWECGTSIPDFETLIELSKILDVSLYEFSICKRIDDESISKRVINKFKSIKDFKKYKLKKKISIILLAILSLFFLITTYYTLTNYGTVEIYEFKSLDENYYIEGNYTKAKDYNVFNIIKVINLKKATQFNNFIFEIYDDKNRIIAVIVDDKKRITSNKTLNILTYSENILKQINNKKLTLYIKEDNNTSVNNIISFNFQLIKKYDNKLF